MPVDCFRTISRDTSRRRHHKHTLTRQSHIYFEFAAPHVGEHVGVQLKTGLVYEGTLEAVDTFLNIRLRDARFAAETGPAPPGMETFKTLYVRGSSVQYLYVPKDSLRVDDAALTEVARVTYAAGY